MNSASPPSGIATHRPDLVPYLAGAGIGILSWIAFGVAKDPLGVTTAYARTASLFAVPVLGKAAVAANSYWKQKPFALDYGVLFLVGMFVGAFLVALFTRGLKVETVSEAWKQRFGASAGVRMVAAFVGGAMVMYGARMAGGCTSGHGISGTMQMALSSWVFLIVMFAAGTLSSGLLFSGGKGK
jgi:hypothetical protein